MSWWRRKFLWPRILYWTALAFLVLGLVLAAVGDTDGTLIEDRDTREAGAVLGLIALAAFLIGKYWMDAVERARHLLPCPSCGAHNEFSASYCGACGMRLRLRGDSQPGATASPVSTVSTVEQSDG